LVISDIIKSVWIFSNQWVCFLSLNCNIVRTNIILSVRTDSFDIFNSIKFISWIKIWLNRWWILVGVIGFSWIGWLLCLIVNINLTNWNLYTWIIHNKLLLICIWLAYLYFGLLNWLYLIIVLRYDWIILLWLLLAVTIDNYYTSLFLILLLFIIIYCSIILIWSRLFLIYRILILSGDVVIS